MNSNVPADPLERFFRRLVSNLSALDPGALHRPIPVADIHERLVPYRTHRAALGVDTGEDYEMTVLRLLAGEGGYALLFPEDVRDALAREAASPNPDTGMFKQFPDATILLEPEKLAHEGTGARGNRHDTIREEPRSIMQPAMPVIDAAPAKPPAEPVEPAEELPFSLDEDDEDTALTPAPPRPREGNSSLPCAYCGGTLPVGRTVLFCPHCGQNVGVVHCPTCGSELDVGWEFCITCGQKVTGIG
jgi:hypothetical protein